MSVTAGDGLKKNTGEIDVILLETPLDLGELPLVLSYEQVPLRL